MRTVSRGNAEEIMGLLGKEYPAVHTTLYNWRNNVQFLVAVMLSAQCTDERVNIVTKGLFRKYKTAGDFSFAGRKQLEQEIRSTGFYRNKAKHIIAACKIIHEQHHGKVPSTMDALLKLPGVARKTANVILSAAFNKNEGIVVDTHVKRVSFRLGLTKQKNPVKIEQDLMKIFPQKEWGEFALQLLFHGRAVCQARKPKCSACVLNKICPSAFKVKG